MVAAEAIERWLSAYVRAWADDDSESVAALFTPDALYFTAPYRPPLRGREAISAWWIEQGESRIEWSFDRRVIAREEDLYVVRARTTYPQTAGSSGKPEVYHNLWLVTLAEDGRAKEFVEYWMLEE